MRYQYGDNYQIRGIWKDESGVSYFGYAETEREAKEMIDLLAKRKDCEHIVKWEIVGRGRKAQTYKRIKEAE